VEDGYPQEPVAELKPIDPMEYVRVLWRRKWVVVGVALTVLAAGALHTLRQPKIYSARAALIIDPSPPKFLDEQVQEVSESGPGYYWMSKEYYETQYKVITSRSVSERVVDKLGLRADLAFLGLDGIKDEEELRAAQEAIDAPSVLQGKLKVEPVKDSRVVHVVVNDLEPNRAALLANEVADAYMSENLGLKMRLTQSASDWLEDQLVKLGDRANRSELTLYDFKKQADMLTTSLEDRVNMVSQRLLALNTALTEVRLKIAGLRARVESMQKAKAEQVAGDVSWAEMLPGAPGQAELISKLKLAYLSARTECAELKERYLADHPRLVSCVEKLGLAQEAYDKELRKIVTSQQVELDEALAKERNLQKLLEETKAEAFEVNKRQIDHDRLRRESENDQRLYDLVLKRLKELEVSGMLKTSNVRVLDRARPNPFPVKPNVPVSLALSLLLGVLSGVAGAFLLEWLDDRIVSQRDVEERLGLPFLGLVPMIPETQTSGGLDLHIHHNPKSSVAEHCRAIRTNLLFMSPDKPFKTLVVTSSGPQDGKSTNVISLGIAMAQSGSRVLLVDTDMRRPRLHKAFGVPNDAGVSSLIVGQQPLEGAVKTTEVPNLWVLPCGPVPPNPAELLHTESFKELLAKLGEKYDRVILDSPPIGAVADALVLSVQVDGVVLVLRAGGTRRDLARRAVRSLSDLNARVFGAILNNVDTEDRRYGGYYAQYYRYGYYYGEKKDQAVG
jgi:polysaccharide biosynthesis transport protein